MSSTDEDFLGWHVLRNPAHVFQHLPLCIYKHNCREVSFGTQCFSSSNLESQICIQICVASGVEARSDDIALPPKETTKHQLLVAGLVMNNFLR